jgi:hypothetical protein
VYETRHRPGPGREIVHVVDPFARSAKKAVHSMLADIPARRDHVRAREETFGEVVELVFVAARPVKGQDKRPPVPTLRFAEMVSHRISP